jgi:phosphoglucomutase
MKKKMINKLESKVNDNMSRYADCIEMLIDVVDIVLCTVKSRKEQFDTIGGIVKLYISKLAINKYGEIIIVDKISQYLDSKGAGNLPDNKSKSKSK